jgi:NADPH:quinone reductase-like Zn-dependent oxidoreductase
MSNQAAWIPESKGKLEVKEAPMPTAGKGEVVIKNHAVAVNPVDCEFTTSLTDSNWKKLTKIGKIQDYGIFIQKYPNVTGTDVAGEVHEVGEGVTHLKKGDRVLAYVMLLMSSQTQES